DSGSPSKRSLRYENRGPWGTHGLGQIAELARHALGRWRVVEWAPMRPKSLPMANMLLTRLVRGRPSKWASRATAPAAGPARAGSRPSPLECLLEGAAEALTRGAVDLALAGALCRAASRPGGPFFVFSGEPEDAGDPCLSTSSAGHGVIYPEHQPDGRGAGIGARTSRLRALRPLRLRSRAI